MESLTDKTLDDFLGEGRALIEISAPGCAPCKHMAEKVLPGFEGSIRIGNIDGTANRDALNKFQRDSGKQIIGVPVMLLYQDGKLVQRYDGPMRAEEIREFINV